MVMVRGGVMLPDTYRAYIYERFPWSGWKLLFTTKCGWSVNAFEYSFNFLIHSWPLVFWKEKSVLLDLLDMLRAYLINSTNNLYWPAKVMNEGQTLLLFEANECSEQSFIDIQIQHMLGKRCLLLSHVVLDSLSLFSSWKLDEYFLT